LQLCPCSCSTVRLEKIWIYTIMLFINILFTLLAFAMCPTCNCAPVLVRRFDWRKFGSTPELTAAQANDFIRPFVTTTSTANLPSSYSSHFAGGNAMKPLVSTSTPGLPSPPSPYSSHFAGGNAFVSTSTASLSSSPSQHSSPFARGNAMRPLVSTSAASLAPPPSSHSSHFAGGNAMKPLVSTSIANPPSYSSHFAGHGANNPADPRANPPASLTTKMHQLVQKIFGKGRGKTKTKTDAWE